VADSLGAKLKIVIDNLPPDGVRLAEIRNVFGRDGIMLLAVFLQSTQTRSGRPFRGRGSAKWASRTASMENRYPRRRCATRRRPPKNASPVRRSFVCFCLKKRGTTKDHSVSVMNRLISPTGEDDATSVILATLLPQMCEGVSQRFAGEFDKPLVGRVQLKDQKACASHR